MNFIKLDPIKDGIFYVNVKNNNNNLLFLLHSLTQSLMGFDNPKALLFISKVKVYNVISKIKVHSVIHFFFKALGVQMIADRMRVMTECS